jgi:hypothetical protein
MVEQSVLLIANARALARKERELNNYIAHAVGRPIRLQFRVDGRQRKGCAAN